MNYKNVVLCLMFVFVLSPFSLILAQKDFPKIDIQLDKYDKDHIFESRYFKLRGTKGFFWSPEQYLAEIPILKRYQMNFLVACYGSFYKDYAYKTDYNEWKKPFTEQQKQGWTKVVEECKKNEIMFCFGMNSMLRAAEPLVLTDENDFQILLNHYRWFQKQGVKWFYVAIDDVNHYLHKDIKIEGKGHSLFTNKLYEALKANDPEAKMIFCPTWYWGNALKDESKRTYLEEIGEYLDKDIFVFWTGPDVVPCQITLQDAITYKEVVKHELILWDNYPVNDFHNSLHLGPLMGRDPDLYKVHYGMMGNPMRDNEMNRLPLFTMADYMLDPINYDAERSVVQAIKFIAETPSQQQILKDMVEMYPGYILYKVKKTSLNNVRVTFEKLKDDKTQVIALLKKLENLLQSFKSEFPDKYSDTKNIIKNDIEWIKKEANI